MRIDFLEVLGLDTNVIAILILASSGHFLVHNSLDKFIL